MRGRVERTVGDAKEMKESTIGQELVAGLIAVGIAVGCLVPPIIHFISGPLGPLIGGFVAAGRVHARGRGIAVIATTLGTGLVLVVVGVMAAVVAISGSDRLPDWLSGLLHGPAPVLIAGGVWLYGATLGAIGGAIAAALAGKRS